MHISETSTRSHVFNGNLNPHFQREYVFVTGTVIGGRASEKKGHGPAYCHAYLHSIHTGDNALAQDTYRCCVRADSVSRLSLKMNIHKMISRSTAI